MGFSFRNESDPSINLDEPLDSDVYEELKPLTKRIAEENFEKAQRMTTLVNDIIKLSRLDEKSIAMEKEALSLRSICREVMEVLAASAKTKNLSINLEGDSGLINGVEPVIYEMIYNLVDNAIKYNKTGGTVNINIQELTNSAGAKNKVVLSVHDTGIGIPAAEKDRIFERFYRIDKSRSRSLGGTGLGLSMVKHAAKYHNASVLVTSEEGSGSTFTVVFEG